MGCRFFCRVNLSRTPAGGVAPINAGLAQLRERAGSYSHCVCCFKVFMIAIAI